jgi:hypothetical protein
MRRVIVLAAALVALLALAAPAHAGGPAMRIGAAEDLVKQDTLVEAKAKLTLAKLAGLDTIRVTAIWTPGQVTLHADERDRFRNLDAAAALSAIRVVVSVYHFGSRTTPLTDERRTEFSRFAAGIAQEFPSFREVIVGNEPNLNRFWLPQFGPAGENVAAPSYLELLAKTYDALKQVSPRITVWGGGLAPRGIDRPGSGRDTHSPTKFIRDMGAAYRASGRTTPVMDGFAFHPYCDTSSQPPRECAHPRTTAIGIADYDKLVSLLGEAFDGTAQPGSALPILYDEFGVETVIPAAKERLYTGAEPATIRPVDEATQAAFYREAVAMAFCQPNVRGLLLFHVVDETERPAWQSGLYYLDGTRKASALAVSRAAAESRRGVVPRCAGMQLTPKATLKRVARFSAEVRCNIDCAGMLWVERVPSRVRIRALPVRQVGGVTVRHRLGRLARGRYVLHLSVRASVNRGPAHQRLGAAFSVG